MGWREISSKLRAAVEEKKLSVFEISKYLDIDLSSMERMLNGDLSFDDRAHMYNYLKRIAWILELDFDELWRNYEEESQEESEEYEEAPISRVELFMMTILSIIAILLIFGISSIHSKPLATIENTSGGEITVEGVRLKEDETYPVYRNVRVFGNRGEVFVETFGKKKYKVKMESFEVIVNGRGKNTGSR